VEYEFAALHPVAEVGEHGDEPAPSVDVYGALEKARPEECQVLILPEVACPARDHYDAPHHVNPAVTSVALTAYNTQTFVADFIESVHAQNLPVTEVIFVDDGFLDKTAEMACATRQRGLSQPNRGLSAGRNAGATQHRFALLDAVRASILGRAAHT
jgi:hypothetical protein